MQMGSPTLKPRVKNLADCRGCVGIVSRWMWKNWGKEEGLSLKDVEYRTRHSMFRDRVPMTFVAFFGKTPVAVASLWQNDLRSRQDIAPYLAELYVLPRMRGVGLGTALQNFALDSARKLGLKSIYLITSHKNYYERNGWKFIGSAPFKNGVRKRVYVHKL